MNATVIEVRDEHSLTVAARKRVVAVSAVYRSTTERPLPLAVAWKRVVMFSAAYRATAEAGDHDELRNNGRLHVAVVAHQMAHHFLQVGERFDAIDEIGGGDFAVRNQR